MYIFFNYDVILRYAAPLPPNKIKYEITYIIFLRVLLHYNNFFNPNLIIYVFICVITNTPQSGICSYIRFRHTLNIHNTQYIWFCENLSILYNYKDITDCNLKNNSVYSSPLQKWITLFIINIFITLCTYTYFYKFVIKWKMYRKK